MNLLATIFYIANICFVFQFLNFYQQNFSRIFIPLNPVPQPLGPKDSEALLLPLIHS